jgi:CheY-like chemotaxis protein
MTGESGQTKSCIRVLHLENDPLDAELIETALREHNIPCSITCAYTQEMFDAALQKGDFDLILSDSHLPGFDTQSALTMAHERYPHIPFIFVSGTASPNIKGDAFRHGAFDFISKDDLPKLARAVDSLFFLNKRKNRTPLPETGRPVMIQCRGFRCLGYLGDDGKWREYGTSSELQDVVDWSEA